MSFAGSVSAMITSLKNNSLQRRSNRNEKFEYVERTKLKAGLKFKNKLSQQEFSSLSEKMKKDKRKKAILLTIIYSVTLISSVSAVIYFIA